MIGYKFGEVSSIKKRKRSRGEDPKPPTGKQQLGVENELNLGKNNKTNKL